MSPLPRASYGASAGRAQKTETKKTTTTKAKQKNESKNVMFFLLAMMMLSTANGWVLQPDDKAHDSSHTSRRSLAKPMAHAMGGSFEMRHLLRVATPAGLPDIMPAPRSPRAAFFLSSNRVPEPTCSQRHLDVY